MLNYRPYGRRWLGRPLKRWGRNWSVKAYPVTVDGGGGGGGGGDDDDGDEVGRIWLVDV